MNKNFSLEEVFNNRIFLAPDYQRGYAWETEHCNDLLEDLELLPENFDHYTGTLVFFKNGREETDEERSVYQGYDIVDGQQRLTSLVILLSVIKTFLEQEKGNETRLKGLGKSICIEPGWKTVAPFTS